MKQKDDLLFFILQATIIGFFTFLFREFVDFEDGVIFLLVCVFINPVHK